MVGRKRRFIYERGNGFRNRGKDKTESLNAFGYEAYKACNVLCLPEGKMV